MGSLPLRDSSTRLAQVLASYLPRYQLQLIQEGIRPRPEPFCEERSGAILLVDVSGFTALTERFARQGAVGAEQLSGILNRYFGRVTDLITSNGGDIVAFAGDSALAMWVGDPEDLVLNTARAAQSALNIQTELDGFSPAQGVVLRQRAGIGCGVLRLMEVGGVGERWQFVVTGEPLAEASKAILAAQPGDVVMHKEAVDLAKGYVADQLLLPNGSVKVSRIEPLPALVPRDGGDRTAASGSVDVLRNYVLPVVADRLGAGQEQWIAEFRTLTVLFVNLAETRDGEMKVLHDGVRCIQEVLRSYEGTLYQFLMDDKGLTAVCAFGLPPLAHEDDARRAVEAAITMRDELARTGTATSAGIATGTVFCGVYGNDSRRQYTALGNTMNLAARLMQDAGSSLLCDEATCRVAQSAGAVHFESKGQLLVKGFSAPVAVYAPVRVAVSAVTERIATGADSAGALGIIGRDAERDAFQRAIDGLRAHKSACLIFEGEAGIGKTRLLEQFAYQAMAASADGHTIPCWRAGGDSIQQATPYLAWRSIFREAFRLGSLPQSAWRDHVPAHFPDDEQLRSLAPLLNSVLSLDLPETAVTSAMECQALAENTQHLLVSLLKSAAARSGLILLLDDAHWFDSSSWRLVLLAMQQVTPLLMVLAMRPLSEPPLEYATLQSMVSARRFSLSPLDSESALSVVCQRLGVNRLPAEIARFIAERGKGNPLFSEQLAYALRDSGLIVITGRQCLVPESATGAAFDAALTALRFPSTVEGVITSRLDRMPPEIQLTVKVASVIGQRFTRSSLQGIHPVATESAEITAQLESAAKMELIERLSGVPEEYAFRQAITQEVAYNSIPFAQRREIHRRMGAWLEQQFHDNLAAHYPLLAHHWRHADDSAKAIHYCAEAGEQALRNNANQEAVRFLNQALEIDERQGAGDSNQRAEWELQLGKAYVNWSKYIEARAHLENGLRLKGQKISAGNAGIAAALLGQVTRQCLHRAMPARFVARHIGESDSLLKFSRTFEALMEIYYLQDMPLPCLLSVFRSLNLAELAGPSPELARGYSSTGSLVGFMTLHKAANAYFRLAEKISDQIKDPGSRAWVSLARAMYLAGIGEWDLAANLLTDAIKINDKIGDRRRGDDNRMTLCTVQYLQGNFRESLTMAETLYKSAADRLDARCQAEALRIKGYNLVVMDRMADLPDCLEELDSLRTAQMKFGGAHKKQDVHALYAIWYLSSGNREGALQVAEHSITAMPAKTNSFFDYLLERSALAETYLRLLESDRKDDALRTSAQRAIKALHAYCRVFSIGRPLTALHQGTLFWLEGKPGKAVGSWQQSLNYSAELKAPYYQGLAHASLGLHGDSVGNQSHLRQAKELLQSVGALRDLARLDK